MLAPGSDACTRVRCLHQGQMLASGSDACTRVRCLHQGESFEKVFIQVQTTYHFGNFNQL